MNNQVEVCPVCAQTNFTDVYTVEDVWVSKEKFKLVKCTTCSLVITKNAPDAENIGKYYAHDDYISHTDTSEGLFFKVYHWVRNRMLQKKQTIVAKHSSKGNHLDIGAGTGYFVNFMNQFGWKSSGVEVDKNAAKIAKEKFDIDFVPELSKLENIQFEAISMWHVLEHVHTLNDYFEQFNTLLTNNGKVYIAVPNYTSFDAKYYKEHWAAWDVPKHLWHFSPKAMQILAKKHNFDIEQKYVLPFDPFYISLLSAKNSGNSIGSKIMALFVSTMSFLKGFWNVNKASSVVYVLKRNN